VLANGIYVNHNFKHELKLSLTFLTFYKVKGRNP